MNDPECAPRFSVVVPAFNEVDYLPETLRALAAQDFPGSYEVIVVDNNSTDATAEVARRHGVRVVSEHRPGVCQARQAGVRAARGEIVVSTDADTTAPVDWLRKIDAEFADSEVVLVGGPCRYAEPAWWVTGFTRGLFGLVHQVFARTGWLGYISAANTAFRRDGFPGYDTRLTQGGDELAVLRSLRGRGRMVWNHGNVVTTSPRRLEQGLLYSLVMSFLFYYLLGYLLNRVSLRLVLPMAPAFRRGRSAALARAVRRKPAGLDRSRARRRLLVRVGLPLGAVVLVCLGLVGYTMPDEALELARRLRP